MHIQQRRVLAIANNLIKKSKNIGLSILIDQTILLTKDPYAQYPHKKIEFLQTGYVIDEKNGFLELVAYDEALLPPPGGLAAMVLMKKKRFRFEDVKGVEYLGWIQKSNLLINSNAWVSETNMKPFAVYDRHWAS